MKYIDLLLFINILNNNKDNTYKIIRIIHINNKYNKSLK